MQEYLILLSKYGRHIMIGSSILSAIMILLFSLHYITSNTEHTLRKKVVDIIMMFMYIMMFFLYILVGIYVTQHAAIGVCAGIGAFWVMLELKSFIQKRSAERQKNKRREEIERLKRQKPGY